MVTFAAWGPGRAAMNYAGDIVTSSPVAHEDGVFSRTKQNSRWGFRNGLLYFEAREQDAPLRAHIVCAQVNEELQPGLVQAVSLVAIGGYWRPAVELQPILAHQFLDTLNYHSFKISLFQIWAILGAFYDLGNRLLYIRCPPGQGLT